MADRGCEIGVVGLGVMGRNFALNLADRGHAVAVYNRSGGKTRELVERGKGSRDIRPAYTPTDFIALLRRPRAFILLVPAGPAVDQIIEVFLPLLEPGDLVIDGGNSHFNDTDRRLEALSRKGVDFLGLGVSGGEKGARNGPSLMPGGSPEGWGRVGAVLESAAARVNGDPCVAYLGCGSAGHFVKMVHNGIEYGLEQLIAETYDLLHTGLGLPYETLSEIYTRWNREELASYLIEITGRIFRQTDPQTGRWLLDLILDVAKQKGTGIWTSQEALEARVPVPAVDLAVSMRCLSEWKAERRRASETLAGPPRTRTGDPEDFVEKIKNALIASFIVTYAQGFSLLSRASERHHYGLDLETVARIWRGGCIIRAALLEDIRAAFQNQADLPHLLLDPRLGREVVRRQSDWRAVVSAAATWGIPAPALMGSLAYFDGYRRARLPANLIQAQRDYFGAHTYERVDAAGVFHTEWEGR